MVLFDNLCQVPVNLTSTVLLAEFCCLCAAACVFLNIYLSGFVCFRVTIHMSIKTDSFANSQEPKCCWFYLVSKYFWDHLNFMYTQSCACQDLPVLCVHHHSSSLDCQEGRLPCSRFSPTPTECDFKERQLVLIMLVCVIDATVR